jgi:hypothetical protein
MFKFRAVLARTQPFLSRSVEKRGDQFRFKCIKMVNYCVIDAFAVREESQDCKASLVSIYTSIAAGVPLEFQFEQRGFYLRAVHNPNTC